MPKALIGLLAGESRGKRMSKADNVVGMTSSINWLAVEPGSGR
jgi:hypothetical protein